MTEAAHLHPFAEAGDDDPRNGIALTPAMHWAMDRHQIAPGPEARLYPKREALAWRVERFGSQAG